MGRIAHHDVDWSPILFLRVIDILSRLIDKRRTGTEERPLPRQ